MARIAGENRFATAVALSQAAFPDGARRAVLVSGEGFVDALPAGPLAARLGAPLLLSARAALPEGLAAELSRLAVDEVVAVGGQDALAESVLDAVRRLEQRPRVRRIAAADRWGTAAAVALDGPAPTPHVVVATGNAFADGLSAAALGDRGAPAPLLLVTASVVPAATATALDELRPARITVLGGAAAVSGDVVEALLRWTDDVVRLSGRDRHLTSIAVFDRSGDGPRPLLVAGGTTFADGLAAGAAAAALGARLVVVPRRQLDEDLDAALRARAERVDRVTVVGGKAAVSGFAAEQVQAALSGIPPPGYTGTAEPLPPDVRARMDGVSWRPGCPVGMEDLAYLRVRHWGFDEDAHQGELVVAAEHADTLLAVFATLWEADFPLASVRLVDDFAGDDDRSMEANNTSAFNCRTVAGTTRWSEHAYGRALDLNPVQNPYVAGGRVSPSAGRAYLDRADVRPGMVVDPGPVVQAFADAGWGWGGHWRSSKDFQHFSASGR